jgi:hypothetical protein
MQHFYTFPNLFIFLSDVILSDFSYEEHRLGISRDVGIA